jgi:hypothetical protein
MRGNGAKHSGRHRLAKLFDVAGRRQLCLPAFTFKARMLELGEKDHGNTDDHMHAGLLGIDANPGISEVSRCRCGMYRIDTDRVRGAADRGLRDLVGEYIIPPNHTSYSTVV